MKERGVELDKLKIKVDDLDAEIRSTQGKLQKNRFVLCMIASMISYIRYVLRHTMYVLLSTIL